MKSSICLLMLFVCFMAKSQEFPFDTKQWEVNANGSVLEMFEGKRSLYLHQGKARLKDFEFFTGTLEYDVFVAGRRGFPGIHFRIQDDLNYEEFYIRPHQSGKPDANQYTPVFNGMAGWQLYFGNRFSTAYAYEMNAWNHIKLVIAESAMEVYINDMDTPLIVVPELKQVQKSGLLEFQAGGPSGFHIADLKVTKMVNPTLKGKAQRIPELPEGVIKSWSVSNPFAESSLNQVFKLSSKEKNGLNWTDLRVEERGYANLSRLAGRNQTTNTVFVKVTIRSEKKQVKRLHYGVSDRGILYLNGQGLAASNNNYRSQDFRHLGTIGYHDSVYLSLKKGDNELWIAVSENFGGWGVMAAFENLEGISMN